MTPCSIKEAESFAIDEACLGVSNEDASQVLELWAQSKECYMCPPWKYASLNPGQNFSMKVNATYETELYLKTLLSPVSVDRYSYQFTQHGWYQLKFNSTGFSPMIVEDKGDSEVLDLIVILLGVLFVQFVVFGFFFGLKQYYQTHSQQEDGSENENLVAEEPQTERDSTEETVDPSPPISLTQRTIRLHSLDAFRGLAILAMIFVNYGGGGFSFLRHSIWNGLTFADLIFPWFLWIMGVCLVFSIESQVRNSVCTRLAFVKIAQRSLTLFLIGFLLNGKNVYLPNYRFLGVLQRIGFCYFVNATLQLVHVKMQRAPQETTSTLFQYMKRAWCPWLITSLLVMINLILTFLLDVPGCPKGYLGPGGLHMNASHSNCTGGAAGYIDRLLLGKGNMYPRVTSKPIYDNRQPFDPEGLLPTFLACLTVQLGVGAGRVLFTFASHRQRLVRWLAESAVLGMMAGLLCDWSKEQGLIPINKNLWSLSYVFATASLGLLVFSLLYTLVDVCKCYAGYPFVAAGRNAIFLYIAHEICQCYFPFSWTPVGNTHCALVIMHLVAVATWSLIAVYMHSKRIYIVI